MEFPLYNQNAESIGSITVPDSVFHVSVSPDMVAQVVAVQMANRRQSLAHAKTRAEVRGGGKKPWRQKGTGRARHGSIRSPLWAGGGVTFGPSRDRSFKKTITRAMARKALCAVLSSKAEEKHIAVLDVLSLSEAKTKHMAVVLRKFDSLLSGGAHGIHGKRILLVTPVGLGPEMVRTVRNIPTASVMEARNLNALDVLTFRHIVFVQPAVDVVAKTIAKS